LRTRYPDSAGNDYRCVARHSEGVPTIDHLPVIEPESGSSRRSTKLVVQRTIALEIVAVKGETGDHAMDQDWDDISTDA
jgi:hypothetical protein